MNYKIAVLPGDGIGPEVMGEGTQVLEQVAKLYGFSVELEHGIVGGASIDAHGKPLTDPVLNLAKQSDAVLLGAMGGPKWDGLDYSIRPERALLALAPGAWLIRQSSPGKIIFRPGLGVDAEARGRRGYGFARGARAHRRHLLRPAQGRDETAGWHRARRQHGSVHDAGDRAYRSRGVSSGAQAAQESDVGR